MKKNLTVLLGALTALAGLALVAPSGAQAATAVTTSVSATHVSYVASGACVDGSTVRFSANATGAVPAGYTDGYIDLDATVYDPSGGIYDDLFAYNDNGLSVSRSEKTMTFCPGIDATGTYRVKLSGEYCAYDADYDEACGDFTGATTTFTVSKYRPAATVIKYGTPSHAANRAWHITGKLSRPGDSTYGGQTIRLQRSTSSGWSTYKTCLTGPSGTCAVNAVTTSRTAYRWYFAGNGSYAPDASGSFTLAARQVPYTTSVSKYGKATAAANHSWKITGKLSRTGDSTFSGKSIRLQRRSGGHWVGVKSCTTASTGRCAVTAKTTSRTTYRWYFAGSVDSKSDASPSFTLARR